MYLGSVVPPEIHDELIPTDDPVARLDVSLLQDNLITPILGIDDPRRDDRIDFVGGIRGLAALEKRVDSGDWAVAFALYPTTMQALMDVADAGEGCRPNRPGSSPSSRTAWSATCSTDAFRGRAQRSLRPSEA